MKLSVAIKGRASGKTTHYEVSPKELNQLVLEFFFLRDAPIAFSCFGKGVCKKCNMSCGELSCQITIEELIDGYNGVCEFDYL
jgi:hypothetical protein